MFHGGTYQIECPDCENETSVTILLPGDIGGVVFCSKCKKLFAYVFSPTFNVYTLNKKIT